MKAILSLVIFLILAAMVGCGRASSDANNKTIYIMAAGPLPGDGIFNPSWPGGTAVLHAAELAQEHINQRSDVLPGYTLELILADSGCNISSKYAIAFANYALNSDDKIFAGIIGPACSDAALLLAPIVAKEDASIVQIAPSATSVELQKYTTTFHIFSNILIYVEEAKRLSLHNNWKKVAVLYDGARTHFKKAYEVLLETKNPNMTISFESAVYEDFFPITEISDLQTRIIFAFMPESLAGKVMCVAYHLGLIYPTYQWFFHDRGESNFVNNITASHNEENYVCSEEEMRKALTGIILNNYVFEPNDPDRKEPPVNVSFSEYKEEYKATMEQETYKNLVGFKWSASYYDAMWALVLAVNHSLRELEPRFHRKAFGDREIMKTIRKNLLDHSVIDFVGVSETRVKFGPNRAPNSTISIVTLDCNSTHCKQHSLGQYNIDGLWVNASLQHLFINDTFAPTLLTVHIGFGSIIFLVLLIILVLTALMHMATIAYYNFKPIKATSPNLSHLIFSGCYLLLVSIFVFITKDLFEFNATAYAVLCNLFTFCLTLSISLIFGTICAKIWRVYRIFRHFRTERATGAISDNALIFFVSSLVVLDMMFCVTWITYDPWLQKTTGVFSGTEVLVTPTCTCNHLLEWIIVLAGYKGLLILAVVFLAILNRNIRRKEFKHTKKVSMYVYMELMMAGISLPMFQILSTINATAGSLVMTAFLVATVSGCLGFVFLPSIAPLVKLKYQGIPVNLHMTRRSTISLLD